MYHQINKEMDYKKIIRDTFDTIIASPIVDENLISQIFHPAYKQTVDGTELDFEGFIQHLKAQKQVISTITTHFKSIISEREIVFTNHAVNIEKKDGGKIKVHVIAEFNFQDGKIIRCDELTRLLSGLPEDGDIGSRIH